MIFHYFRILKQDNYRERNLANFAYETLFGGAQSFS